MAKNEVTKRNDMAPAQIDFGEDASCGFEGTAPGDDFSIPFLALLQDLSPQVKKRNAAYVEGAEPGMLFNTVTGSVSTEVLFVPSCREHVYVEWIPRDSGGGFVARYDKNDPIVVQAKAASTKFGKYKTPAGNDLVETFYLYGVMSDGELSEPVVIAFTSAKISEYKKFMTRVNMFTVTTPTGGKQRPPLYAHLVRISSKAQTKDTHDFHNIILDPANGSIQDSLLAPTSELYVAAKGLKELVAVGTAAASYETQEAASDVSFNDEEVPY